jgi:hypothetical protein
MDGPIIYPLVITLIKTLKSNLSSASSNFSLLFFKYDLFKFTPVAYVLGHIYANSAFGVLLGPHERSFFLSAMLWMVFPVGRVKKIEKII